MMVLTALFDCQFRGGRAKAAPQMRATPGTKRTMAEANAVDEHEEHSEAKTVMPHLVHGEPALRKLYPPLEVPEAVDATDPQDDDGDGLVEAGNAIVRGIVEATEQHGRRRRLRKTRHQADDDFEDGELNNGPVK